MLLVQFGAGNIGRSFIGQLFARAGYEVCFVDVVPAVLEALNTRGEYTVEIRDEHPERITVPGVRGVDGRDRQAVVDVLMEADIAGTAVGPNALAKLCPGLAEGLVRRRAEGRPPLDVILCENLRNAADHVRTELRAHLSAGFPLDECLGLVETSIGKMVPLMTEEDRARDPLLVFAEAYNTLICDGRAFLGGVPAVPGLEPKDNMAAYVDRKLFIHNLGHAACAYVGWAQDPLLTYLWEVVERTELREAARRAMWESGHALIAEYPDEFDEAHIGAHIEDLLRRFGNRALGDTIHRVGRDLPRKLSPEDRLIGALRLEQRHQGLGAATLLAVGCALHFAAPDERSELFPADAAFRRALAESGPREVLIEAAGLDVDVPADLALLEQCLAAEQLVRANLGPQLVSRYFGA